MKHPTDPLPTFADGRDRIAYLLAQYKIPISIIVFSGLLWAIWARPGTPDPPPWAINVLASWMLLAMPAFMVGQKIVDWLYSPDLVRVAWVLPGHETIYRCILIPPGIWDDKEIEGASPMPVDEGWPDYIITDYEWLEDVEELRVQGCDPSMLDPGEAVAYHEQVEQYYGNYLGIRNSYAKLYARVAEIGQQAHDDGLMSVVKTKDKTLAPGTSVENLIEDTEEQLDDLPTLDDLAEIGMDEEIPGQGDAETNGHAEPVEEAAEP